MILRKLIVLGALAVSLVLGGPAAGETTAPSGGANNVVIVRTTGDGAQRARAHLQIAQAGGPNVASANIATATASECTGCLSSAVAVQVVLVSGSPDYFAPWNQKVLESLKASPARMVLYAAYQDSKPADWLSKNADIAVVRIPFTVGGSDGAKDLFGLFDDTVARLVAALPRK